MPEEVLLDNARALILHHDAANREVVLHPRLHAGREVAVHAELKGRHGRSMQDVHLAGVAGADGRPVRVARPEDGGAAAAVPALLRPLAEYEAVVG
ncbi:hypothetical protein F1643_03250 [Azospirillum sp. INR13]|uniref:hypothetical protein n=1 Tax=Azospirillum sp. INR13 TaxID=2596919 RepID=UPI0018926CFA|nr:hypothetical protein [Azospirillum sp. INR13]MBF5093664.1 hypothetical protein [Azospirillum sp. INR13]